MTMPWFKMFHEARTDPKLRSLSAPQFRTWFDLMCYASEQPERGVIEVVNDRVLAIAVAEGDVDLLNSTLDALVELKIVSCVSPCVSSGVSSRFITILNFAKRQGQSVSGNAKVSTDRVRKHRQNKKLHHDETRETHETRNETRVKRSETTDRDREEEREKRNTPLTPQGGKDDGGVSLPSQESPTQLRSQRKSSVTPEQVKALTDWARTVIGDRGEMEFYFSKIEGWACSYPLDWIETAILCTAAGADSIKAGKLAPHTYRCLENWRPNGPPKDERATASRQRASLERSTIPIEYVSDPEWEAEIAASYGRKAKKDREAKAAIAFPAPHRKAVNQ